MIKFFRKIRFDLMEKNKTGKYLKYAVGEIILVVIGILIALSINNWNERRKLQNTLKSVYAIIKIDLLTDIKNIDKVLNGDARRDSLFRRVINKEMTKEDYLNCKNCSSILFGFPDLSLNTRGVKLLEDNSAVFNAHQDSLYVDIGIFYAHFNTELSVALDEVIIDYNDNISYFKNNKVWFKDYVNGVKNDELMTYMLTSSDYLNRVNYFYLLYYRGYLGHLKNYRKQAHVLIEKLNTKIE